MGIWYDKEAYELLKTCSEAKDLTKWNEYRKNTNYTPVNLRFADLDNFYLRNADLQNVDFRGAHGIGSVDFNFSNVKNAAFFLKRYYLTTFLFTFFLAFISTTSVTLLNQTQSNFITTIVISIIIGASVNTFIMPIVFTVYAYTKSMVGFLIFFIKVEILFSVIMTSLGFGILGAGGFTSIQKAMLHLEQIYSHMYIVAGFISAINIWLSTMVIKYEDGKNASKQQAIMMAINPTEVVGFDRKYLESRTKSVAHELQKEVSELSKAIETTEDDEAKKNLLVQQEKLEEKIHFYTQKEKSARPQKAQIENVISELQSPYKYIHQTTTKIEWHNRFYYGTIVVLIGTFIYAITHGYIDQKVTAFASLFTKETLPSFGTIFGVILFFGSPVLIGISLIIYFITQINKNIDKVTELQEQERNIKQIASTIKAKAEIGMSDEEFVKETKALIQKYQEGMMAGIFPKEKIMDKDDKSSSLTYREKLIANSMSKLLMQAIKSK